MSTAGSGLTEADLEQLDPTIAWRRPIRLAMTDGEPIPGARIVAECWGCRYCMAMLGQRGRDIPAGIATLDEFADHMTVVHDRVAEI